MNINGKSYDFDRILPVVDGVRLRSKEEIKNAILDLLHYIGYKFSSVHPMPAILRNYRDVNGKDLVYMLKTLCTQISSCRSDFPWIDYDVEFFGFASSNHDRICIILFEFGGLSVSYPCSLSLVSKEVAKLMDKVKDSKKFKIVVS